MTYFTGLSVIFFSSVMMPSWSISNLSSTNKTPSLVISAVVLPGTKSLWMTYRSSFSLIVFNFDGWLPNCVYAVNKAPQVNTAADNRTTELLRISEKYIKFAAAGDATREQISRFQ